MSDSSIFSMGSVASSKRREPTENYFSLFSGSNPAKSAFATTFASQVHGETFFKKQREADPQPKMLTVARLVSDICLGRQVCKDGKLVVPESEAASAAVWLNVDPTGQHSTTATAFEPDVVFESFKDGWNALLNDLLQLTAVSGESSARSPKKYRAFDIGPPVEIQRLFPAGFFNPAVEASEAKVIIKGPFDDSDSAGDTKDKRRLLLSLAGSLLEYKKLKGEITMGQFQSAINEARKWITQLDILGESPEISNKLSEAIIDAKTRLRLAARNWSYCIGDRQNADPVISIVAPPFFNWDWPRDSYSPVGNTGGQRRGIVDEDADRVSIRLGGHRSGQSTMTASTTATDSDVQHFSSLLENIDCIVRTLANQARLTAV